MNIEREHKKRIKKILLPLASIFLIFQSYKLVINLPRVEIQSHLQEFIIAWVINMFVTGIFALTGFAYPTQRLLPDSYYTVQQPKRLLRYYKILKLDLFRRVLLATLWRGQKQRKKYFNGSRNDLGTLIRQSKKSEFGHLFPFIILTIVSFYFIVSNTVVLGLFTMLWNILGNLYPIILQRHHRMRIRKILSRLESASF